MRTEGRHFRWIWALSLVFVTGAHAQDSGSGLLSSLGSLFSSNSTTTSSTTAGANSTLLSQQQSVIASNIQQNAAACAAGNQPGTVGYAIQQAQNVHQQLASVRPNTDQLFQASNGCFGGLSQLFDLSDTIPSLGSIMNAATAAVLQYAKQQVCQAVNQVTPSVTTPLNQAISGVTGIVGTAGINGMIGQQLGSIDPNLGSSWNSNSPGGTYSINTNSFGINQSSFSSGGSTGSSGSTSAVIPVPTSTPTSGVPVMPNAGPGTSNPTPPPPPQSTTLVDRLQNLIR